MKRRVLQISNYYTPHIGGIEQTCQYLSEGLKDEYEVKVICFSEDKGTKVQEINGIQIIKPGVFLSVARQDLSFSYFRHLHKVIKTWKPDIIHFHYPNPFVAAFLRKYLKRNFKFVLYWHLDIVKQKVLGKLFNPQTKALLERADIVVSTSPNYIEGSKWLTKYKYKTTIIPCCVSDDIDNISEDVLVKSNQIKEENKNKTIVFALGRHVEYKGIIHLVNASKYLDDSFRIYIAGKGPLTESLIEAAKDDKKIIFLGRVEQVDLKAYLNACDIFAFPSITKNEAFGIALAEALALGKASVTFTIPGSGVNYVSVNKKTGIEVPNMDDKAFADALIKLQHDESLRHQYEIAAKERCNNLFRYNEFKENINKMIEEL